MRRSPYEGNADKREVTSAHSALLFIALRLESSPLSCTLYADSKKETWLLRPNSCSSVKPLLRIAITECAQHLLFWRFYAHADSRHAGRAPSSAER